MSADAALEPTGKPERSVEVSKRVFQANLGGKQRIYVCNGCGGWVPYSRSQIAAAFEECASIKDLAGIFGISPLLARRMLSIARVDYVQRLYKNYLKGVTCAEIARENGMKPETLSKMFNDNGLDVWPGRRRPRIPTKKLFNLWQQTRTVNRFAKALKVHWETAAKLQQQVHHLKTFQLFSHSGSIPGGAKPP